MYILYYVYHCLLEQKSWLIGESNLACGIQLAGIQINYYLYLYVQNWGLVCFQVFYRDICKRREYLDNTVIDPVSQTPYTYVSPLWISYGNQESFLTKVSTWNLFNYNNFVILG